MQRMVSLGSEYYPMAFYSGLHGGGRLPRFEDPTEGRFLQPMCRIANEVDAVFAGLIAQEQQPILLGPIPDGMEACHRSAARSLLCRSGAFDARQAVRRVHGLRQRLR